MSLSRRGWVAAEGTVGWILDILGVLRMSWLGFRLYVQRGFAFFWLRAACGFW